MANFCDFVIKYKIFVISLTVIYVISMYIVRRNQKSQTALKKKFQILNSEKKIMYENCKMNRGLNPRQSIYVPSWAEFLEMSGPRSKYTVRFIMTVHFQVKWLLKILRIQPIYSQLLEAPREANSRSRSISGVNMRPIVSPGSRFWIWQVVDRLYWLILSRYNL